MGNCFGGGGGGGSADRGVVNGASAGSTARSEVLFFPIDKLPCRFYTTHGHCKFGATCKYSHVPTALTRLIEIIMSSKQSIDVCVFSLTLDSLADALLTLHKRGVQVRIITDNDQVHNAGSDIVRLQQAGVQVRVDNSDSLMHNKFAIIDNRRLLNGSLNWSLQGVTKNRENVVVSDEAFLVGQFVNEFQRLWVRFANNKI